MSETPTLRPTARLTGLAYLVIILCGLFAELFVRGAVYSHGDAEGLAANIVEFEGLMRLGIAADLVMILADVVVGVLFWKLLRPVSETLALMAAFFRLAQAAVLGANLLHMQAAVDLAALDPAGTLAAMDWHGDGYRFALVFFGASCLCLSALLWRSAHFPRWLAVLPLVSGVGYLADTFLALLAPMMQAQISDLLIAPTAVSEIVFCLYLLIRGCEKPKLVARA
ncbi:DUF4386 domain-containing protein [Maricaulis parjimensis]|uniref:DUF4386 domain-containing protein n=1 Tax=Maricaulis parjimensis TaxID=144023 RepID=UPI0019394861|nr:DUF4386 domain-containing protein [Maricaulis parjimensis]